jgi:ArsR family transcriptional regulator, lead/cadmium/zinc/bismuth-responsive transcriptional repressor
MNEHEPTCESHEHGARAQAAVNPLACQRAADIFRALGDPTRLRILTMLMRGEMCVTEIAAELDDNLSAVSQRLKLLRSERVVRHRRDGKHVYYGLADQHIAELVSNALAHVVEPDAGLRHGTNL